MYNIWPKYRRFHAVSRFIQGLLDGSIDAPDLHSYINFRVPIYPSRHYTLFHIPTHSTSYGHDHSLHRTHRNAIYRVRLTFNLTIYFLSFAMTCN